MLDAVCVSCDELSATSKSLTVVLVGLAVLVAFAFAYKKYPKVRATMSKLNTRSMITKLKVKL